MAITGITTPQGWISRPRRFSLIMSPQSAARRLKAEAEEAQRGDERDREGEAKARLHDERARHVREHLAEEDLRARHADPLGCADEVALDDVERGAADDPGNAGSGREAHHENEQPQLGPDRRHGDEREDDLREGEDDVHRPHEHVVEGVAGVRGDEPDRDAEDDAERRSRGPRAPGWTARPRGSG